MTETVILDYLTSEYNLHVCFPKKQYPWQEWSGA